MSNYKLYADLLKLNEIVNKIYQNTLSEKDIFELCLWGINQFEIYSQDEKFIVLYKYLIEAAETLEDKTITSKNCTNIAEPKILPALISFLDYHFEKAGIKVFVSAQTENLHLPFKTYNKLSDWSNETNKNISVVLYIEGESISPEILQSAHILLEITSLINKLFWYFPIDDLIYARLYLQAKLNLLSESHDIKIAVIGSSAARSNILDSKLPEKAVNLGITSLDVYYTILIGQKAIEFCPSIHTIIWPIPYIGFPLDLTVEPNPVQRAVLAKIIRPALNDLHGYTGSLPVDTNAHRLPPLYERIFMSELLEKYLYSIIMQNLKNLPYYNQQYFTRPSNGDLQFCFQEKSEIENRYAANVLNKMQLKLLHFENCKKYIEYIKNFFEIISSKGIRLIGVIPPATNFYRETLPPKVKERYDYHLKDIFDKYGFPLYDFYENKEFDYSCFADYAHLNERGAEKLTRIITQKLNEEAPT